LFQFMRTQWICPANGHPTGLNYVPLQHRLDRMNLPPDEYEQLETEVRIMESAALAAMRTKT
jgi:hypothetical protein